MMQHKKAWSIACLLLSLLLLFVPWSKDYSTSSFRGNIGWSSNTKYSGDEINAAADTVEDGASPFELIKFSFYYADILYGYTEGGLAGAFRAASAREYILCAVWIISTLVAHVLVSILHFTNKRFRGYVCPAMVFFILGLYVYLRTAADVGGLYIWGFVALAASVLSCILWELHVRQTSAKP